MSHRSPASLDAGGAGSAFAAFVDGLLENGDRVADREWFHGMSQLYFIKVFPYEVDYVLQLERIEEHLALLEPLVALPPKKYRVWRNAVEGFADEHLRAEAVKAAVDRDPDLPNRIWRWLSQDYACLGYPIPPLLRDAAARAGAAPPR